MQPSRLWDDRERILLLMTQRTNRLGGRYGRSTDPASAWTRSGSAPGPDTGCGRRRTAGGTRPDRGLTPSGRAPRSRDRTPRCRNGDGSSGATPRSRHRFRAPGGGFDGTICTPVSRFPSNRRGVSSSTVVRRVTVHIFVLAPSDRPNLNSTLERRRTSPSISRRPARPGTTRRWSRADRLSGPGLGRVPLPFPVGRDGVARR